MQVFDIPLIEREVTEVRLVRRRCRCGVVPCTDAPAGSSGPTCYGPNLRAFATLLATEGQISTERTAKLVTGLVDIDVLCGFLERCAARLNAPLAQFETALKQALHQAPALGVDETPIRLAGSRGDAYTARSDTLTWYGAAANRGHAALDGVAILPGYRGVLVRDDYVGYHKYDADLAGVQLYCAHVLRALQGVIDNAPDAHRAAWAQAAQQVLREAGKAVARAHTDGHTTLDEAERTQLERVEPGDPLWDQRQPPPPRPHVQDPPTRRTPHHEKTPRPPLHLGLHPRTGLDQQRQRASPPRHQSQDNGQWMLARTHPSPPPPTHPLLPHHHPHPRTHRHARHPRRPHRQPMAPTQPRHPTHPVNGHSHTPKTS